MPGEAHRTRHKPHPQVVRPIEPGRIDHATRYDTAAQFQALTLLLQSNSRRSMFSYQGSAKKLQDVIR